MWGRKEKETKIKTENKTDLESLQIWRWNGEWWATGDVQWCRSSDGALLVCCSCDNDDGAVRWEDDGVVWCAVEICTGVWWMSLVVLLVTDGLLEVLVMHAWWGNRSSWWKKFDVSWYLVALRCGLQLQFVSGDNYVQIKKIVCYWCRDGDDALIKKTNGARERLGQVTAYIITKYFQV